MKTLFVDDEITALEIIRINCNIYNIDADFMQKPEQIKQTDLSKYDLIITDYMMPTLSGLELIKYAQEKKPDLYFAVVTAVSKYEIIKELYNYNILEYILKPIDFNDILEVIKLAEYRKNKRINIENISKKINKLVSYGE